MSDIEENIADFELDDNDGNRTKKIREYSFSPTKTPSKNGRDALNQRKYVKWSKRVQDEPEYPNPYNRAWIEGQEIDYYKISDFIHQRHRKVREPVIYDIENFRMVDQPNYDGVDRNITLWCTCDPDTKPYF